MSFILSFHFGPNFSEEKLLLQWGKNVGSLNTAHTWL